MRLGRRSSATAGDDKGVSAEPDQGDAPRALLALYDDALPAVYGYFVRRCGDRGAAEDLTSETFLAAMDAARKETPPPITVPWLIGVARHKLADHYRRRSDRFTVPVADLPEQVEPAEIVRMLKTIIGPEDFRRGMDLYYERCDGTAATVEDFLAAST